VEVEHVTKRKAQASPPIIRCSWLDASMSAADHWQDGAPKRPTVRGHVCVSVGYMTHIDEHFVQITQTLTTGQHAHVVNIPRAMVQTLEGLAVTGPLGGA
jgi:hypothetical protein